MRADQGVLAVGAEPSVGSRLAWGAGQRVIAAGSAVFGPSARLEVQQSARSRSCYVQQCLAELNS
jgi:hypothetical protein